MFSTSAFADSWPQFRGPTASGVAVGQSVPVEFGESKNLTWKVDVEGKAWSSPVISDGVVWLTTAIENQPTEQERIEMLKNASIEERKFKQLSIAKSIDLKLLSLDLKNGRLIRTIDLTTVQKPDAIHNLNSYASPTPVLDGGNVYCHFGTYGTFCVQQKSGEIKWQRKLTLAHSVGPGSSPYVHGDLVVLIQDGIDRQYVTALNKESGEQIWEIDRPEMDAPDGDHKKAFSTPIAITDSKGREQLICMSSQWIVGYDPKSGSEIWKVNHGNGFSVVPQPVYDKDIVYFSTGFGKPELWAVRVNGTGDVSDTHVLWTTKKSVPAKPSPLFHEGLIYLMEDNGIASCLDAKTGTEVWRKRLSGKYTSSPLLAGGNIYIGSHDGKVTVIKPGREYELVAENQLDEQIMASPAVVDNALLIRTATSIYRFDN